MSDVVEQGGGAAVVDAGGAPAGDGGGATATREWMANLPEDLRNDPTLARYETPEAQLRGHLEARRLAGSRVIVPGKDADDATRAAFYSAIGRPDKAEGYEFEVPEGQSTDLADRFRARAFDLGMPKDMAEQVVRFNNEMRADEVAQYHQRSVDALAAWKAANPDHEAKLGRMNELFRKFGGDELTAGEIEARLGTGKMLDLFAKMAAATTEAPRVDGDPAGAPGAAVNAEDADKAFTAKMQDQGWRARLRAGDVEAQREYDALVDAKRQAAAARAKNARRED